MSGPVTSVARVEDVQIFLKDPVFLEQGVLSVLTQSSVYWRQIAVLSQGIETLILVEISFIYLFIYLWIIL